MKQKTEIVFEIEELITVKSSRNFIGFCRRCDRRGWMLKTETAAALSDLSEREIFRLIERNEIHFVETERIFVCWNSLSISKGVTNK
jgi:hypothetical protein